LLVGDVIGLERVSENRCQCRPAATSFTASMILKLGCDVKRLRERANSLAVKLAVQVGWRSVTTDREQNCCEPSARLWTLSSTTRARDTSRAV